MTYNVFSGTLNPTHPHPLNTVGRQLLVGYDGGAAADSEVDVEGGRVGACGLTGGRDD